MNIRELSYMAELVRRDGDEKLQGCHGILNRLALYKKLTDMIQISKKSEYGSVTFAVFKDIVIE